MNRHSLAFRIVVSFSGLLAIVMLLDFALVSAANQGIARDVTATELRTGEKIFQRLLKQRAEQLTQAARVLASDTAFREAVSPENPDRDTIASALRNHGGRIKADLVMLSGLDEKVLVDTAQPEREGQAYPFSRLQKLGGNGGSGIELVNNKLYQIVRVPVKAPLPIAWVSMGFAIDDKVADDLRDLANLHVSFLGYDEQGWHIYASTLASSQRNALPQVLGQLKGDAGQLPLNDEDHETRLTPLGEEQVYAVLSRSLKEAMAPFDALQRTLAMMAALGLIVCLIASVRLGRRITNPVRSLAKVAERIQQGDYQQTIAVADRSEIGQLAGSLAHMQTAIAEREAEISKLAYVDSLTGLPNRVRFNQLLSQGVAAGQPMIMLLVNLDRFQQINDTLGHPFGDRVLAEVGSRLRAAVRHAARPGAPTEDVVARLSGDDFAVLLHLLKLEHAQPSIDRILAEVNRRVEIDGRPLDLRATAGIACFPDHGHDATALIRSADQALYRAKRSGVPQQIYDPSLQTFREEHLSLLGDLQKAVASDELTLYYQPKVSLHDGKADEAEALVRWIHPQKGFVPPGEFIPFAEQTGYIKEVTRWVLRRAVQQGAAWAQAGQPVKLSVNLSTRDLLDDSLPEQVAALLAEYQLSPALLCLEITESGLMEEPGKALAVLQRLRQQGLALAIDDYGTGYSSLAYMRRLPVTELKIDRAFVLELASNASDALIVRSTIELGHGLGLKVVAEGVEDMPTVNVLRELGCDRIQGYVFGKPMKADDFVSWRAARA